jgi:ferredoxin
MDIVNPIVNIDHDLCTTPFDCKRCLRICPAAVFWVNPVKMARGIETDKTEPGAFALMAKYRDKCTGCKKCVEVCPVNALTLIMPEEVRA